MTEESGTVTEPKATPTAVSVRFRPLAVALLAGVAALVVVVDLVSKYLVVAHLTDHPPVRILGGLIYLDLTRNGGAAFSFATGYTWIFPLITLVVIGWICWSVGRLRSPGWAVGLGLVLGGALGNLGDRLFRAPGFLIGHVVDFISAFEPYGQHFAIFNLADSALSCGVVLLVLLELTGRRRDGTRVGGDRG